MVTRNVHKCDDNSKSRSVFVFLLLMGLLIVIVFLKKNKKRMKSCLGSMVPVRGSTRCTRRAACSAFHCQLVARSAYYRLRVPSVRICLRIDGVLNKPFSKCKGEIFPSLRKGLSCDGTGSDKILVIPVMCLSIDSLAILSLIPVWKQSTHTGFEWSFQCLNPDHNR